MGGWKDYYAFRSNNNTSGRKGFQKSKREFNLNKTPAQKEKIFKQRANIFSKIRNMFGKDAEKTEESIPAADIQGFSAESQFGVVLDVYNQYVYQAEKTKEEKIAVYREMAKFPEISFAIDEYVDEAVNPDREGKYMELIIKSDSLKSNDNIRKTLMAEWDYLWYDVVNSDDYAERWFREFLIDSEIGLEKVVDNNHPEKGIIKLKKLRTTRLLALCDDLEEDDVDQFVYKTETDVMYLDPEQVAYTNSGDFEFNQEEDDKVCLGLLEVAKVAYRRLKQLEDALIIYRLVRAPERRVFNVETGFLPPQKAEQYLRDMMNSYRQKKFYNGKSGEVSEALDVMAMTEDYWFPVFNGGKQSSVTTLPGGENLGQMEDVEYFLKKLYRALKVPLSRFESDTGFSLGDTSDITREEVKFKKQVYRYVKRFSDIFKQTYLTHLRLKGIVDEYGISESDITVSMFSNNLFDRYMEAKIDELQFTKFGYVADMVDDENALISKEIAFKHYLEWSDDLYEKNEKLLAEEQLGKTSDNEEETPEFGGEGE
jgi:hypothetical protein